MRSVLLLALSLLACAHRPSAPERPVAVDAPTRQKPPKDEPRESISAPEPASSLGPSFGEVLSCNTPPSVWKVGEERFVSAAKTSFIARVAGTLDTSWARGLPPSDHRTLAALEGPLPRLRARFSTTAGDPPDGAPRTEDVDIWFAWNGQRWTAAGRTPPAKASRVTTYPWIGGSVLSATILDAQYRLLAPPTFSVSGSAPRPALPRTAGSTCLWHVFAVDRSGTVVSSRSCDGDAAVVVWRDGRAFVPTFPSSRPLRSGVYRAFARDGEVVVETLESQTRGPSLWRLVDEAFIPVSTERLHLLGLERGGVIWALGDTEHRLQRWSSSTGWQLEAAPPIARVLAWTEDGAPTWATTRDEQVVSRDAAGVWRRSDVAALDGRRVHELIEDGSQPWLVTLNRGSSEPYRLHRAGWTEPPQSCRPADSLSMR